MSLKYEPSSGAGNYKAFILLLLYTTLGGGINLICVYRFAYPSPPSV